MNVVRVDTEYNREWHRIIGKINWTIRVNGYGAGTTIVTSDDGFRLVWTKS